MNQDAATPTPEETTSLEMEAVEFEPSTLLAELKAKAAAEPPPENLPDHLPLSAIATLTPLFQPRGLVENHVHDLIRVVKSGRMFDPVEVIQVGSATYLVDGHHRREAYEFANVTQPVPVIYFNGTIEEAVLQAGRANSKAKQNMTNTERMDFAWRLVRMGGYTRKQVHEASGASVRQVAIMRDALKALGTDAFDHARWWSAREAAAGRSGSDLTDDEREERLEAQASDYASRLRKEFSGKLIANPELAARALAIYFGRKLYEVVRELRDHVSDVDVENDDDSDF